ncbi:hypothetical protein ACLI09_13745 [Flavobacterium sp. RHBU_24]|uniref:hypothetical protein n=1 Tax=Flavobacterium sp. RHBU_24 TaxID=3391185 RepID=UPI003985535D
MLQVTNASEKGIELRALMSSKDSPTNWDLRVFIREKLIAFIQENSPENLPVTRVEMHAIPGDPRNTNPIPATI